MSQLAAHLPDFWRDWIRAQALARSGGDREHLDAGFFGSHTATLRFDDGSVAAFHYARPVKCSAREELLLITEHCGYLLFPNRGVDLEFDGEVIEVDA